MLRPPFTCEHRPSQPASFTAMSLFHRCTLLGPRYFNDFSILYQERMEQQQVYGGERAIERASGFGSLSAARHARRACGLCAVCAPWVHVCAVCLLTRCPSADKIDSTRAQSPSPQEHAPNYIMNVHKLAKVERPANQRALGQTTLARIAAQLI